MELEDVGHVFVRSLLLFLMPKFNHHYSLVTPTEPCTGAAHKHTLPQLLSL